ncbi:MAG: hypothetical protein DRP85_09505 [Candidatus Makaraimicrobium thalassicum]|nr:MAG: hypothetical protein DRP85_09505 [Candidatus Omnitrophota bacterium]
MKVHLLIMFIAVLSLTGCTPHDTLQDGASDYYGSILGLTESGHEIIIGDEQVLVSVCVLSTNVCKGWVRVGFADKIKTVTVPDYEFVRPPLLGCWMVTEDEIETWTLRPGERLRVDMSSNVYALIHLVKKTPRRTMKKMIVRNAWWGGFRVPASKWQRDK